MKIHLQIVLTLCITSYAQHDGVRNNKQLFYTPINRIHNPVHSYHTNPLLNQHSTNYPYNSQVLYTGQPIYDFWSQLGHPQVHYPFQNVQLIPLNMLHPAKHQQSHQPVQLPGSSHNQHISEDDTEVIVAANNQHLNKFDGPQSDHPNVISPVHPSVKSSAPKKDTPLGFQRGHVEYSPLHKELEYQAQLDKINWGGFQRGHVERAPSTFPEDPELRISMQESTSTTHGFDRGAVESIPDRPISGVSLTRAAGARVVCYFANWAWYRQGKAQYLPENVDPNLCTHVIYAFATYDKRSMQLKVSDPVVDDDNQFIERVVYLKRKNPNLKVLIAIGGWTDSGDNKYSFLASTYNNRRNFARESLQFLRRYNLDGISIDWHYPVCWQSDCTKGPKSDRQNFVELAKELHSMYSSDGYLVVASLSGYKEVIDVAYDVPSLSKNLDFMNIMTYDYHGSWESRTGHLSPLYEGPPSEDLKPTYNSNFTMEYYVTMGADRDKLVMGIPFYGQSFTLENKFDQSLGSLAVGPGNPGDHTQQAGMLAYYEICKLVKDSGWTVRRDTSGSWGPYAYKDNQWVGYDDMDSIRRKARHVATNNFGGIFAFTLDLDDFNNDCCNGVQPLLRTISKELLGIPFSVTRADCTKPPNVVTPFPPGALPETTTQTPIIRPTPSRPENPVTQDGCNYNTKPHPRDCNAYYTCSSNTETMQRCPFGLHWNKNIQSCDWPEVAGCQQNPSAPITQPPPLVIPIAPTKSPDNVSIGEKTCVSGEYEEGPACDQYYLCSNGMRQLQRCGSGLHWNQEMKLCDWPQPGKCKARSEDEMQKFSEPCQEGSFSGSKKSCDTYYVCVHGERMEFHCQGGLYWNDEVKICDWPNSARCKVEQPDTVVVSPVLPTSTSSPNIPSFTEAPTTSSSTTTVPSTSPSTTMASVTEQLEVVRPPSSDLSEDFMIVCYFTNWAWYRPGMGKFKPENINPDLCTHIVYGFAVLDYEQLIIKPHDSWADIDNRFYEQVVELKRKGKKVTIAIGGWNDSAGDKYSRLVNTAASRRKFIRHVVEFIQKYNFDGLDLDWEYPKCWQTACNKGPESDKPNFAAFLREIHEAFRPHGLLLSSAVSPSKTIIDAGYDVPALSRYLDWIAVMTYDFHGQWDKKTGHVAPLYFHEEDDIFFFNANYSINYWIGQGADRKKIVMGVPLYGQSFTLVNPSEHGLNAPSSGGGTAGEYTRASGFLAYYEICQNIQRNGWTIVHDETGAMGPYAYKGNQWVSFDDVAMVRKKAELIRQMNLGGGMVWALDLDDFSNSCGQGRSPLLTTLRSVLGRPQNPIVNNIDHAPSNPNKIGITVKPDPPYVESTTKQSNFPIRNEDVEHCDEQFKPHEKDCNKYYQCIFGRYMTQSCPNGLVWNKNHCDWPRASNCQPGQTGQQSKPKPVSTPRPQRPMTQEPVITQAPILQPQTESTMSPILPSESTSMTTYRPPKFTTTAAPTKSPEWCKQNWCPTPKPLPPNKYEPVNVPSSNYKVVCYFTNWAWYRPGAGKYKPEDINFNLCTHIAYGFAVLNPTTMVIRPHDGWADIDNQFYKQVTKLKERGIKVVLALGGWNDSLGDKYSKMANDPQARRRFINHAIEFIETWDFDGLDLDWEYPKCWQVDCDKGPASDKQAFAALVRELKEAFEPRGLLLSAAVSPNKKVVDEGYDVPTVSKYLDWIAVMTYDYHGQWDKKTGHNAPMFHHPESDNPFFNANYSINYWIDQGADRKKIVMGMPMYGQSFTIVDPKNTGLNSKSSGGAQAGEFTRSAGFLSYYEICNYVQKRDWTVVQDESHSIGPYAYKGNQWVSFDDADQIRRKSEYIKQMGLGGGMIWALDLDDFNGVCGCEKYPLLKTINRVLRNWPEPDPKCQLKRIQ